MTITDGMLVVLEQRTRERGERVDEIRGEIARLTRELGEAMADEQEARELLAAERRARANALTSQWERFGAIVNTGADPIKAAMIVREEGGSDA